MIDRFRNLRVAGYCPMGCGETLFLGDGGHVTCSWCECPEPTAADLILGERETAHIVDITETSFAITHPLRDRIAHAHLIDCGLHTFMRSLAGPPRKPGRYRATRTGPGAHQWTFNEIQTEAAHGNH